jgi:hypothetical protein
LLDLSRRWAPDDAEFARGAIAVAPMHLHSDRCVALHLDGVHDTLRQAIAQARALSLQWTDGQLPEATGYTPSTLTQLQELYHAAAMAVTATVGGVAPAATLHTALMELRSATGASRTLTACHVYLLARHPHNQQVTLCCLSLWTRNNKSSLVWLHVAL